MTLEEEIEAILSSAPDGEAPCILDVAERVKQAALNAAAGVCESVRDVPEEWGKLSDRRWSYSADRCRREILALTNKGEMKNESPVQTNCLRSARPRWRHIPRCARKGPLVLQEMRLRMDGKMVIPMSDTRNTSREGELLPCPFCGGEAEHNSWHWNGFAPASGNTNNGHAIYCANDSCAGCPSFSKVHETKDEAVEAWNTRPAAKPLEWNEIAFERGEPCAYNADSASGWWRIDADDDEGVSLIAPDGDCIGVYPSVHMAKKAADKFTTNWLRSWMK